MKKLLMWFGVLLFGKKKAALPEVDEAKSMLDAALCDAAQEQAEFIEVNDAALAQAEADVEAIDAENEAAMEALGETDFATEVDMALTDADVDDAVGGLVAAEPSAECYTAAQNAMCEGKKVNAIVLVRTDTGWGLKEAKAWVDEKFPAVTIGDLIKEQMEGTTSGGTAPS